MEELVDGELQQTEYFTVTKIPGQPVVYPEAYCRLEKEYLDGFRIEVEYD